MARARAPEADATFAAALSLLERLPPGRRLIQLCDRDLMRSLRVRTRPMQAIRVAEACGTALERAGLLDAAVRYAFELGRSAWDLEPALAKDGLRRVAQLCPRCPEAPGAAWLLALLEGRATLWTAPGSRANGRLDTSAVTASRTFRLDGPKSVDGVTLTLSAPAHFLVTLLGAAGQPLSRFERDPGTSEAFDTPKRWPKAETRLRFAPVSDVAAIRVDLTRTLVQDARIVGLDHTTSPYPAVRFEVQTKPTRISRGAREMSLVWTVKEPHLTRRVQPDTEAFRPVDQSRWRTPWPRSGSSLALSKYSGAVAGWFYGEQVRVVARGSGPLEVRVDDGARRTIDRDTPNQTAHDVTPAGMQQGWHRVEIRGDAVRFAGLEVVGRATATVFVRFRRRAGWTGWQAVAQPGPVTIPPRANRYQVGVRYDSRGVAGEATAEVEALTGPWHVVPGPDAARGPGGVAAPSDDLAGLLTYLRDRRPPVVYARAGTAQERAAAADVAAAAGLRLISDDVVLNHPPRDALAIGTPRTHRMLRPMLATMGLHWSPDALADRDGTIGLTGSFAAVSGLSPDAVVAAVRRLLPDLAPERTEPPYRLFASHTLEAIRGDQRYADRAEPAPQLRLARPDRRSAQVGVAANQPLAQLSVRASALSGPSGAILPPPQVRFAAGYAWSPFFGDERVPNPLVDQPPLPLLPRSSLGVWLTVESRRETPPGTYRGTVTVTGDGATRELPITAVVEPVQLTKGAAAIHSYAMLPWFLHRGSAAHGRALRSLAADEARTGVTVVQPPRDLGFAVGDPIAIDRIALGPEGAAPSWRADTGGELRVPRGEAAFFATGAASGREISLAASSTVGGRLEVSVREREGWRHHTTLELPKGPRRGFSIPLQTETTAIRLVARPPAAFRVARVRLWSEAPFRLLAGDLLQAIATYDRAFADAGLAPPRVLYGLPASLDALAFAVDGVGEQSRASIGPRVAAQLAAALGPQLRERIVVRVADEPANLATWAETARPYRQAGLSATTAHGTRHLDLPDAEGVIGPWCPSYEHEPTHPYLMERKAQGDEVWWYACGAPPTRLSGRPIDNLPLYWLTGRWGFSGVSSFAALSVDPSDEPVPFRLDHGLRHRLMVTPDGAIVPTTRRELEAEGIRDLRLIEHLKRLPARAQALEAVLRSVVPSRFGYATDPQVWLRARGQLYDLAILAP